MEITKSDLCNVYTNNLMYTYQIPMYTVYIHKWAVAISDSFRITGSNI